MNTTTENIVVKLAKVKIPGKTKTPTSKSNAIRKLSARNFTTGEIRAKLQEVGIGVHYSEIYRAVSRAITT